MPIQRITKGGETFFRHGNTGRLYKTLSEAKDEMNDKKVVRPYNKKKGVDNKACWEGYRYAGTENGKDKCVKVKRK